MRRTYNWVCLDLLLCPWRQLLEGQLEALRLDAEPSAQSMRRRHPNVRVRSVADLCAHGNALQLRRQDVEHRPARYKHSCAEGNSQFIARSIVIHEFLLGTLGHLDAIERGDLWRRELVQGRVNMPAIETGSIGVRDVRLMEGLV